jgi:type I restriction enzyme R subunit
MVVCDSADQARMLFIFSSENTNPEQKTIEEVPTEHLKVATCSEYGLYKNELQQKLTASLILHDVGSKDDRKQEIEDFKDGKIDILFVYNMLLTGFDAKRLKKLYIGRLIKDQ